MGKENDSLEAKNKSAYKQYLKLIAKNKALRVRAKQTNSLRQENKRLRRLQEQNNQAKAVVTEPEYPPYHQSKLKFEPLPRDLRAKIKVGLRNIDVVDQASKDAKKADDQKVRTELRKIIARRKGAVDGWKLKLKN